MFVNCVKAKRKDGSMSHGTALKALQNSFNPELYQHAHLLFGKEKKINKGNKIRQKTEKKSIMMTKPSHPDLHDAQ